MQVYKLSPATKRHNCNYTAFLEGADSTGFITGEEYKLYQVYLDTICSFTQKLGTIVCYG